MSPRPQPGKALAAQPCAGLSHGHRSLPKPIWRGPAWEPFSWGGFTPATHPARGHHCALASPPMTGLGVNASASSHPWLLLLRCCPVYPSATTPVCCSIPPVQGQGRVVSCSWLGAPSTAPQAAPSLSAGRMGCRQGRQRGRLAFLAPALGGSQWGRCARAPMLPCPAHISSCTSAGGAGLHPQEWTQREGLRQKACPGPWGGLGLDTDTACHLHESLKDSESFLL